MMPLLLTRKTERAIWCLTALMLLAGIGAYAQEPMPVYVTFNWPADIPSVDQDEINKAFLGILGRQLHFWAFRKDEGNHVPRLEISVQTGAGWSLLVEFITPSGVPKTWTATLYADGELVQHGNPPSGQWKPRISDVFLKDLVLKNYEEILQHFKNVAVSKGVLRDPKLPKTRVVLPLPWDAFWQLGLSEFKLQSRVQDGVGVVYLHSHGLGSPAESAGPPPCRGILIEHTSWEVLGRPPESISRHSSELAQANVEFVYLEKFNDWQAPADLITPHAASQLSAAP